VITSHEAFRLAKGIFRVLSAQQLTPQSATVGLTLDQLDWAKRQDVTIVGVIREGERMPPNNSAVFSGGSFIYVPPGVRLILLRLGKNIHRFLQVPAPGR
jgi:Trk K+ transport system NAD-binding subunit